MQKYFISMMLSLSLLAVCVYACNSMLYGVFFWVLIYSISSTLLPFVKRRYGIGE